MLYVLLMMFVKNVAGVWVQISHLYSPTPPLPVKEYNMYAGSREQAKWMGCLKNNCI